MHGAVRFSMHRTFLHALRRRYAQASGGPCQSLEVISLVKTAMTSGFQASTIRRARL
jgi:hypothetical protein